MTKLERKLIAELRRFGMHEAATLVIAVSGGADSVSLLDALVRLNARGKLPMRFCVAHLNHQLRGEESDADEAFVIQLASQFQLDCFTERVAIAQAARASKQNLEATARQMRYGFLARVAQVCGSKFVLTAHTQNDQAETVVMRLLRGSGTEGLRGIHPVRSLNPSVTLLRPMLATTRAEVLEHCAHYDLSFRSDSSNDSLDFTRNRIRQEVLPLLRSFNPRCEESLARMAELMADDQEVLHQMALTELTKASLGAGLDAKQLRELTPAIRRKVLRLWLEKRRGSLKRIDAIHLKALERLILRGHGGRVIELPDGWQVRLTSGILTISLADDSVIEKKTKG